MCLDVAAYSEMNHLMTEISALQRNELRRSRMELAAAQDEARLAREEARQMRAELRASEAERMKVGVVTLDPEYPNYRQRSTAADRAGLILLCTCMTGF